MPDPHAILAELDAVRAETLKTLRPDGGLVEVFGGAPMNGAEWLASYAGHEAFHHRQIDAGIALARQHEVA